MWLLVVLYVLGGTLFYTAEFIAIKHGSTSQGLVPHVLRSILWPFAWAGTLLFLAAVAIIARTIR